MAAAKKFTFEQEPEFCEEFFKLVDKYGDLLILQSTDECMKDFVSFMLGLKCSELGEFAENEVYNCCVYLCKRQAKIRHINHGHGMSEIITMPTNKRASISKSTRYGTIKSIKNGSKNNILTSPQSAATKTVSDNDSKSNLLTSPQSTATKTVSDNSNIEIGVVGPLDAYQAEEKFSIDDIVITEDIHFKSKVKSVISHKSGCVSGKYFNGHCQCEYCQRNKSRLRLIYKTYLSLQLIKRGDKELFDGCNKCEIM